MDVVGYPLRDALKIIEENNNKIINIIKVTGSNNKFNNLNRPYVIRKFISDKYITLYVSYF